jgi:hypothetical protein
MHTGNRAGLSSARDTCGRPGQARFRREDTAARLLGRVPVDFSRFASLMP